MEGNESYGERKFQGTKVPRNFRSPERFPGAKVLRNESSSIPVCHRHSVQRQRFGPMSLFFVAADAYSRLFCKFFSVANVNSFLSMNWMKLTSFSSCFEQFSLTWQSASISSAAGVSLNTSDQDRGENKWSIYTRLCYLISYMIRFVAGLIGLVPARLLRSHSLQYSTVCTCLCRCCAFDRCNFWKLIFCKVV